MHDADEDTKDMEDAKDAKDDQDVQASIRLRRIRWMD